MNSPSETAPRTSANEGKASQNGPAEGQEPFAGRQPVHTAAGPETPGPRPPVSSTAQEQGHGAAPDQPAEPLGAFAGAAAPGAQEPSRFKSRDPNSRFVETWETAEVDEDYLERFQAGSKLQAPPPRPGFAQRWIRTSLLSQEDVSNISLRNSEGWRPRPFETVPEGYTPPTIAHGTFEGFIGMGEMVLCERPERIHKAAKDQVNKANADQVRAVEENLFSVENQDKTGAFGKIEVSHKSTPGRSLDFGSD